MLAYGPARFACWLISPRGFNSASMPLTRVTDYPSVATLRGKFQVLISATQGAPPRLGHFSSQSWFPALNRPCLTAFGRIWPAQPAAVVLPRRVATDTFQAPDEWLL